MPSRGPLVRVTEYAYTLAIDPVVWPEPRWGKDQTMTRPQNARQKVAARTLPVNQGQRPMLPIRVYPHGLLLLSPLIFAVTLVILLALLSIFVTWLLIVLVLVTAIVVSDLVRRSLRRFFEAHGRALQHRAAGYS
jgi:Flp pilus assembly protein TadB